MTRLNTVISPQEMTVDPVFGYDRDLDDVSNVRNLGEMRGVYGCEEERSGRLAERPAMIAEAGPWGVTVVAVLLILVAASVVWRRSVARRRRDS